MALTDDRIDFVADRIGNARILILGDIMLDEYFFGSVSRISPEAPVPIVEITSSKRLLGGAANVAANIRTLGGEPVLLGVAGQDEASVLLSQLLKQKGISHESIVQDLSRQTTIKTRVIAHSQQVVRTDREDRHELDAATEKEVMRRFMAVVDDINAVIISDYGKGVITSSLLDQVITACTERNVFVAVDPKETHFFSYQNVSLITPNHHEAGFAYGHRIITKDDLLTVGNGLLKKLNARSILITRGSDGMSLFCEGAEPTHIPTFARKVYDVTGAGDTVIAAFVSAISAGADLVEAAVVANAAAGSTIGEIGTASITAAQLRRELKLNIRNGNLVAAAKGV